MLAKVVHSCAPSETLQSSHSAAPSSTNLYTMTASRPEAAAGRVWRWNIPIAISVAAKMKNSNGIERKLIGWAHTLSAWLTDRRISLPRCRMRRTA
jgi:hypothetical protein